MATPPFVQFDSSLDTTGRTVVGPNLGTPGKFTAAGAIASSGALNVSVQSTTALTVARVGTTNPALTVDTNIASSATGIAVTAQAAGGSARVAATSSAGNENLQIDAKGSGQLLLNPVATGSIAVGTGIVFPQTAPVVALANTATDSVLGYFAGTTTVGQKLISSGQSTSMVGIAPTGATLTSNRWRFHRIGNLVSVEYWARVTTAATTTPVVLTFTLGSMVSGSGGAIPTPEGGTFGATTAADGGGTIGGQTIATQLATLSTVAATTGGTPTIVLTITTTAAAAAIAAEVYASFWYDISA